MRDKTIAEMKDYRERDLTKPPEPDPALEHWSEPPVPNWERMALIGVIGVPVAIIGIAYGAAFGWFIDWSNRRPGPPGWQQGAMLMTWIVSTALVLFAVFGACQLAIWVWRADRR